MKTYQLYGDGDSAVAIEKGTMQVVGTPFAVIQRDKEPSQEEMKAVWLATMLAQDFERRIEQRVFGVAREWGYGSLSQGYADAVVKLRSYRGSSNAQYAADAVAFCDFEDATWAAANALLNGFQASVAGGGELPNWEQVAGLLPGVPEKPMNNY